MNYREVSKEGVDDSKRCIDIKDKKSKKIFKKKINIDEQGFIWL